MGQMIPITLPADGNWPTIVGDSIMIIGPRQNELTEEQRYFNPVYLMTYPGKEHLKAQMIRAGACDCDPTIPNRRIGVFSVAPDKKVSFSQGNLQYLPAINLWKFADTQYEYLGNANKYLKPTFRNWVDLFGWSANNTTAPFGVSTSTNAADYAGDFVDWGTNTICGDAPGTWRTLSADEWEYLLKKRKNASDLYGVAQVAGVNGMIILPDDWEEANGIVFKSGLHSSQVNDYSVYQSFTDAQWLAMENAGKLIEDEALREQIKGAGIGTSATRGEIIKKLERIKYIQINEKTQIITPTVKGEAIYDIVNKSIPDMLNPDLTASWEKGLDMVAKKEIDPKTFMEKLEKYINSKIDKLVLR